MNRRALAWVGAAVVFIIVAAWWLTTLPAEVNPSPPSEVVERVELPAPPGPQVAPPVAEPVAAAPTALRAEPDAGVLAEVEIEVVQNWKQLIGVRVELAGPGGRVSRPTDVMGFARFTLPPGSWRITRPELPLRLLPYDGGSRDAWLAESERASAPPLEVTAPLTRYRLELPTLRKFRGRVVDCRGQPVIGAEVRWGGLGVLEKKFSDPLGGFAVETAAEVLRVQASFGSARSMVRTARPDEVITLVLEEWTQLKVDVSGAGYGHAFVRVSHRDEIVALGLDDEWLQVPVGALSVLARRSLRGRPHSGKGPVDAKAGIENHLELELHPTPPITGTLVDADGRPMPGLGVHLRQVEYVEAPSSVKEPGAWQTTLATIVRRGDGGVPALTATTRTNHLGEFAWMPGVGRSPDPVFQVIVVELWQAKADPVLVQLDDAPLEIVVEPVAR